MRRICLFVDIGNHLGQRLGQTGHLPDKQSVARDEFAVFADIAADSSLEVAGGYALIHHVSGDHTADIRLTDIGVGSNYKNTTFHEKLPAFLSDLVCQAQVKKDRAQTQGKSRTDQAQNYVTRHIQRKTVCQYQKQGGLVPDIII